MITSGSCWEDVAQCLRKPKVDLRQQLNLPRLAELILNRVFDRDDVDVFLLHRLQRGIKRRRFAGTGRPGHQDDAVAAPDEIKEARLVTVLEANLVDRRRPALLVEDAITTLRRTAPG